MFDLSKLKLKISNDPSYRVYIDSIATRLLDMQKIESHEVYRENLYWIIHANNEVKIERIDYSIAD